MSQFRDPAEAGESGKSTDIEDLFMPSLYLKYFNTTFANQLNGITVNENDLTPGDRIIERLERFISDKGLTLRPSDGFNHYAVAARFAASPPERLDAATTARFSALFKAVNALF